MIEFALIGHIIGDFFICPNNENKNKKESLRSHCMVYTGCIFFALIFTVLKQDIWRVIIYSVILGTVHALIDYKKMLIESKKKICNPVLFLLDQTIHIVCVYVIFEAANIRNCMQIQFFSNTIILKEIQKLLWILIGGLVCWKPAACFIANVFNEIPNTTGNKANDNSESVRIGAWIGILEREILLILGCMGQYGAMGFVLAAKSLARYKQLEEQSFAEKYLVGTLLSALIALGCVAIISLKN